MTEPDTSAQSLVVGIDASRNRSGGARGHLIGMLSALDPSKYGITTVHLWSYAALLDGVPDRPWLVKHQPPALDCSLPHQLWWQWRHLPREAAEAGVRILLNTDAGSVCPFHPCVVMSRDMLSYEPGEIVRYGWSLARLRLIALRHVQSRSLRLGDGAIYLTAYARRVIERHSGPAPATAIIPHGVGESFRAPHRTRPWPAPGDPVRCLYVSNIAPYKHQWHVVRAVRILRDRGHELHLTLAGGGSGPARARLERELDTAQARKFVTLLDFIPHQRLPALLQEADLFVFASSCENMPNTLVEAMAAGLPIACAQRGPMPEVLEDGGAWFDPENPSTIASAIEVILSDSSRRERWATRARELSLRYSWLRCASETMSFLVSVARKHVK